ncbi:MAG: DUF4294 domain-containing protein [Bacteroidia bacterium]|nr:DUF4294 domain-containing protein [Bacteroidia bacterium]
MALIIIGLNSVSFQAQTNTQDFTVPPKVGFRCRAEIVNGDTLPLVLLNTVYIYTEYVFKTPRQYEQWTRTKHNVKKVYPYAILAAAKLKEYDKALEKMQDEDLKKAFLKVCEKDLRKEFEDELKDLTVTQGKVLMKLIDRESGKTTYEVVKQLRGSFQAAMWQTLARLFGNNMKTEYDAQVEDIMIERAIKLVENGQF